MSSTSSRSRVERMEGKAMSEVVKGDFGGAPFRNVGDLADALYDTIMEYEGQIPLMGVIGVLRLLEHKLLTDIHDGSD